MRRKRAAKVARKKVKPRAGLDRPHCGGKMTKAQFRAFIERALRNARWGPKYECIRAAFIGVGPNPATGHKCKLHRCPSCQGIFPQNKIQADHIVPCIGPEGFVDWNTLIERMFPEASGYQALCKACHAIKSKAENEVRRALKLASTQS